MTTRPQVVDPELVGHLFAPLDGPLATEAYDAIHAIWAAGEREFGTMGPIPNVNVPVNLPGAPPDAAASSLIAAKQLPDESVQMVLRHERDVLNLSVCVAAWGADVRSFPVGTVFPNWTRMDRKWRAALVGHTAAMLGHVTIYLAKTTEQAAADLARALLPALPSDGQSTDWPVRGMTTGDGLTAWEISIREDTRAERRIVVVTTPDREPALSAWTWSPGDVAAVIPPFARYLMHAAKVRYELRVWDDGRPVDQLRRRATASADNLRVALESEHLADIATRLHQLRVDEADLVSTLMAIREMRQTVLIGTANMTQAAPDGPSSDLFRDDLELSESFAQQLEDAAGYLETLAARLRRIGEIASDWTSRPDRAHQPPHPEGSQYRMVFAVDVVGSSNYNGRQQKKLFGRLRDLLEEVLQEIPNSGKSHEDWEPDGDGWKIYLPVGQDPTSALPMLVRGVAERISVDNADGGLRLQLRMAVSHGLVIPAESSPTGVIIEVARLLESDVIRREINDNDADFAVLVSDRLYSDVVVVAGSARPPLGEFRKVRVVHKNYDAVAWLWRTG